jgi:hypothetical protein
MQTLVINTIKDFQDFGSSTLNLQLEESFNLKEKSINEKLLSLAWDALAMFRALNVLEKKVARQDIVTTKHLEHVPHTKDQRVCYFTEFSNTY